MMRTGDTVEQPKQPRDEALDEFRKALFREEDGVGYQTGAENIEAFKESKADEIEGGMVMGPHRHLGLFTGTVSDLTRGLLERYADVEPLDVEHDIDELERLAKEGKAIKLGDCTYDPANVARALRVLGVEGIRTYQTGQRPAIFVNGQGEAIALAPTLTFEEAYAYGDIEMRQLEEIRQFRIAVTDPDIIRVGLSDGGETNLKRGEIERLRISYDGWYLVAGGILYGITRDSFDGIREGRPDIPVEDLRHPRHIDLDRLVETVQAEWRRRDPAMEDVEGYSRCLDDVTERLQLGPRLGCSLPFYVKHFGESPPPLSTMRRHRSLSTPDEWARAIVMKVLGHVHRAEIEFRSDDESRPTRGALRLHFSDVDVGVPDVTVSPAEYRAKRLLAFKSVLVYRDPESRYLPDPWRMWELKEKITEFELEEVRS